jgi:hypothetical protein
MNFYILVWLWNLLINYELITLCFFYLFLIFFLKKRLIRIQHYLAGSTHLWLKSWLCAHFTILLENLLLGFFVAHSLILQLNFHIFLINQYFILAAILTELMIGCLESFEIPPSKDFLQLLNNLIIFQY